MKEIDFLDLWPFKKWKPKNIEIIKETERVIVILNKKEKHIFLPRFDTSIRINIEESEYVVRINSAHPYKKYDYVNLV